MPYADPDKQREACRINMRKYRERKKKRVKIREMLEREVVDDGEEKQI